MSPIRTSRLTFSQALPLMNIVFGHLVGDFNGYFIPGSNVTKAEFKSSVANNAYIPHHLLRMWHANCLQLVHSLPIHRQIRLNLCRDG